MNLNIWTEVRLNPFTAAKSPVRLIEKNQYVCGVSVSNGSIRVTRHTLRFGGLGSRPTWRRMRGKSYFSSWRLVL